MKHIIKIIAGIEMIAGIWGVLFSIYEYGHIINQNLLAGYSAKHVTVLTLLFLLFTALFALTVWAGHLLWRDKERGYKLSILIQALQIPVLMTKILMYEFIAGFQFAIGMQVTNHIPHLKLGFYLGSRFAFDYQNFTSFGIYINVIALIFLITLCKAKKKYFGGSTRKD